MGYKKMYYLIKDKSTEEEIIILAYCKTKENTMPKSDLLPALTKAVNDTPNIEELVAHGVDHATKEEFEQHKRSIEKLH